MDRRTYLKLGVAGGAASGIGYYLFSGDDNDDTGPTGNESDPTDPSDGTPNTPSDGEPSEPNGTETETETETPDSTLDPPTGEMDFISQYPLVQDYGMTEVTVDIPPGAVSDQYTSGGSIVASLIEYDGGRQRAMGDATYDSLSDSQTDSITVEVEESETGVLSEGTHVFFTLTIGDPETGEGEYLAETDRLLFNGNGLEHSPHNLSIGSQNADDPTATYRRESGEGTYAIEVRGVTDETPWQVNSRVGKRHYVAMKSTSGSGPNAPNRVQQTFEDRQGASFRRGFADAFSEYDFSSAGELRFATDIIRSLPEMPAVDSGAERPIKNIQQTFVDGGGDVEDIAVALGGFAYWRGHEAAIIHAADHAAVGVAGTGYDGHTRQGDGTEYYWLEPTPIDGYIGVAPEEMSKDEVGGVIVVSLNDS